MFVYKELFHLKSMLDLSSCSTRPTFDNIPVKARILPGIFISINLTFS